MYDIYLKTGIIVPFPIIADRSGEIARMYGMISKDVSSTETVRNVIIIDDKGIIRTIFIYPLNVGRYIPEILRTVQALQLADNSKTSIPANWIPNEPTIISPPQTFDALQEKIEENENNKNSISWYLSFKDWNKKCIDEKESKNLKK